jgi:hypothetical protein
MESVNNCTRVLVELNNCQFSQIVFIPKTHEVFDNFGNYIGIGRIENDCLMVSKNNDELKIDL